MRDAPLMAGVQHALEPVDGIHNIRCACNAPHSCICATWSLAVPDCSFSSSICHKVTC